MKGDLDPPNQVYSHDWGRWTLTNVYSCLLAMVILNLHQQREEKVYHVVELSRESLRELY
jgi:hypothetical protein